ERTDHARGVVVKRGEARVVSLISLADLPHMKWPAAGGILRTWTPMRRAVPKASQAGYWLGHPVRRGH
ncbi:MAG: hypothetical protein ACRD3J_32130, partial [Thermoanaerobaculia bacterium]